MFTLKLSNTQAFEIAVKKRVDAMPPVLEQAVQAETNQMVKRTQSGQSLGGQKFVKYSTSQPWNWKDQREAEGFQTSYVDLTFSGAMFKALRVVVKRDGFKFLATVFFGEPKEAQKAKGHHTGRLGKTTFSPRKFFGFQGKQRENIASKLRNMK